MNRRKRLEKEVDFARKRVQNAPKETPEDIKKLWEQEWVALEFDLNNLVDEEDDNNDPPY